MYLIRCIMEYAEVHINDVVSIIRVHCGIEYVDVLVIGGVVLLDRVGGDENVEDKRDARILRI